MTPVNSHRQLLENVKPTLLAQYKVSLSQGMPLRMLIGFAFDLADPLVPKAIREAPASIDALRQTKQDQAAIQAGVIVRERLLEQLLPLAYRIEKREPPMLISADQREPALIERLRDFREDAVLPVVVILGKALSVLGLPVPLVLEAADLLPNLPRL